MQQALDKGREELNRLA